MSDDEPVHATLRASYANLSQLLEQSSLDAANAGNDEKRHDDIYLNILGDEVRVLKQTQGQTVITFCSFNEDFFDDLTLHRDVEEREGTDTSGNDFHYRSGAEAVLNVSKTSTYLENAVGDEDATIELKFTGTEERRLSTFLRAEGAVKAWVKLPGSEDVLRNVPHWLPRRFNADNKYCNPQGDPAPVNIETNVSQIEWLIDIVENDDDAEFYPIVVEDGAFRVDVGDDQKSGVSGEIISGDQVKGPDMESHFYQGFEEIFSVLSGKVELQSAPGDNPLAVVREGGDGSVIRHVNGTVND